MVVLVVVVAVVVVVVVSCDLRRLSRDLGLLNCDLSHLNVAWAF